MGAADGFKDRGGVAGVALEGAALVAQVKLCGIADEGGDLMAGGEAFLRDDVAGAVGCAEDGDIHELGIAFLRASRLSFRVRG